MVGAVTTVSGNEFQLFATLIKVCCLTAVLHWIFFSFRECPQVRSPSASCRGVHLWSQLGHLGSCRSLIIVPFFLRYTRLGSLCCLSLSGYIYTRVYLYVHVVLGLSWSLFAGLSLGGIYLPCWLDTPDGIGIFQVNSDCSNYLFNCYPVGRGGIFRPNTCSHNLFVIFILNYASHFQGFAEYILMGSRRLIPACIWPIPDADLKLAIFHLKSHLFGTLNRWLM